MFTVRHSILLAGLMAGASVTLPASAAVVGDPAAGLKAMRELNVISLGNLQAGSDIEGKAFVGGNVTGNTLTIGTGTNANPGQGFSPSDRPTLSVGGNVGSVNLNNGRNGSEAQGTVSPAGIRVGGNLGGANLNTRNATVSVGGNLGGINASQNSTVRYGGTASGNLNANGGSIARDASLASGGSNSVSAALAAEKTQLASDVAALSTALGNLAIANNPSNIIMSGSRATFNAVDNGSGYALFNITAGQGFFDSVNEVLFNIPAAAGGFLTTIINVTGSSAYTLNENPLGSNWQKSPYIIWNFGDATSIKVQSAFYGSLLAPNAFLTNSSQMAGSIVAAEIKQGAAFRLGTYAGGNPIPVQGQTPVPEPATWLMMIFGFGMVGALLRRRRQASAVLA